MKLYMFPIAPNPTRVRLYLAEKRALGGSIDLPEVAVSLVEGEQKRPEHLRRNPLGKLPVLELADGSFLTESLAIVEYLEELYPDPPMIGVDPIERARVRERERIAEIAVVHPIARQVHATNSPLGLAPNPAIAADSHEALARSLPVVNAWFADGRPFVAGDRPTIADCTLAAGLQFARFGKVEIDPDMNHLLRWDRDYREREPARAVLVL